MTANPSTGQPRSALDAFLKARGIKQVWLADETDIDASDISRIVNGMRPGRERAHAIAKALRASCTELGWSEHDEAAAA
jgi:transcriptional regulator with XRE-family HTH domain